LKGATSKTTVVLPIIRSTDTRVAIVGSEGCPVGTIGEIFCQLRSPISIGSIRSRTEVSNGIVDDLVFGCGEIEAGGLTDHFL
jgi:hypothetical protein